MEPVEKIEYRGHVINIYQDDCTESPREWDNLGTIVYYKNSRYILGDVDLDRDELQELPTRKDIIILPVYAYIHSGIRLRTGSFQGLLPQGHAEFDLEQSGWIYVEKSKVKKEYGWKVITAKRQQKIEEYLEGEIKTLDQYFSGDVYGFVVEGPYSDDSVWGFYGDTDYAISEAKDNIDCGIKHHNKKHCQHLKEQIKHHVPIEYRKPVNAV